MCPSTTNTDFRRLNIKASLMRQGQDLEGTQFEKESLVQRLVCIHPPFIVCLVTVELRKLGQHACRFQSQGWLRSLREQVGDGLGNELPSGQSIQGSGQRAGRKFGDRTQHVEGGFDDQLTPLTASDTGRNQGKQCLYHCCRSSPIVD
eukprot:scaffold48_cov395-Prasinococcus_capsulatus_cf.AAC.27